VIEHKFSVIEPNGTELTIDYLVENQGRGVLGGYRINTALLVRDTELFVVYDDSSSGINIVWYTLKNGKVKRLTLENAQPTILLPQSMCGRQYKVLNFVVGQGTERWLPVSVDVAAPALVMRYKVNMIRTSVDYITVDAGDSYPVSAIDEGGRWVTLRHPSAGPSR
jgi:hypothetical protein